MDNLILIVLRSTIGVAVLAGGWKRLVRRRRDHADQEAVHGWLTRNTRDQVGQSHADVVTIAKGTGLSKERVRTACLKDDRVFRHETPTGTELWSVRRLDPASVYENRGPLIFG